jgi:protein-tyrosine phosphatase
MKKILFVCLGNICRSPMAEFIMKALVESKGLGDEFYIESAATSREELGNPVYPPVKRVLEKRGINCTAKRARQITAQDGDKFDYIICMDSSNVSNTKRILSSINHSKIYKLLDFTAAPRDVADPWYTGNFSATENDVDSGCNGLLQFILSKKD